MRFSLPTTRPWSYQPRSSDQRRNVAGIQARIPAESMDAPAFNSTPLVANPQNYHEVLLVVPSIQDSKESAASPFLQTYDVFTQRHVFRQALTRNNTTIVNIGPNRTKLIEPSISLMKISSDGAWLATVEEWLPPASDSKEFADDEDTAWEKTKMKRQSFLKFWLWNQEQQHWMLETRIDMPHQSAHKTAASRVFDLAAHPHRACFATIGEDGFVRVWRPKTSKQDGSVLRGAQNEGVISWSCQHVVEMEQRAPPFETDEDTLDADALADGKLAFSEDASILVAAFESNDADSNGLVQFIDTHSGQVKFAQPAMWQFGLAGLAVVERYLVVLSEDLRVWDLITNSLVYAFELEAPKMSARLWRQTALLAANADSFVVSIPASDADYPGPADLTSSIIVFDPKRPKPLFSDQLPTLVTGLAPRQQGFVALDAAAQLRFIAPSTTSLFRLPAYRSRSD